MSSPQPSDEPKCPKESRPIRLSQLVDDAYNLDYQEDEKDSKPEELWLYLRRLHPDHSECPWTLVRITAKDGRNINYGIDQQLTVLAAVVPFAETSKHRTHCDLVVATFYISSLCAKLHEFTFDCDVNPILPTQACVDIDGFSHAKRNALLHFLETAVKAIRFTRSPGPSICYRKIAKLNGLGARLERTILDHELEESDPQVREQFMWNALVLGLSSDDDYKSPLALKLLRRNFDDWYYCMQGAKENLHELQSMDQFSNVQREDLDLHIVSLLRGLLWISDRNITGRQSDWNLSLADFTPLDNLILYNFAFGIQAPLRKGLQIFNPSGFQEALSRSRLFAVRVTSSNFIKSKIFPDVKDWSSELKVHLPIGFPDNHLDLPSQLLNHFNTRQMRCIKEFFEQIYSELPSLKQPANNILLLLIWSSNCTGRLLRELHEWALSEGGELVRQDLARRLTLRIAPAEVALLLAAFLSLERLYPYMSDLTRPSGLSILGGRSQYSTQQNLDAMIYSSWRVVLVQADPIEAKKLHLLLVNVLKTYEPKMRELYDPWALYWERRLFPQRSHDEVLSLLGQTEPLFTAFFETHDKSNTQSTFEEDSNDSTTLTPSERSQESLQHKEVGKRRGCCAFFGLF